jgi:hypothetical protein
MGADRSRRITVLKPFLSIATLALALALLTAGPASAATPCWKVVVSDWFADGRIDNTYPLHCYGDALRNLPEDVRAYADASDEISRALQDAIRHDRADLNQREATAAPGHHDRGGGPTAFGGGGGGGGGGEPPKGFLSRWIDWAGPKNAGSIPLPLLVLAGIAVLLLGAATASFVTGRIQARRVVPAPAPAQRPPEGS